MREAMAVTGYVESDSVDDFIKQKTIEIRPDRDVPELVVRVASSDVEDVRVGNKSSGFTLVQLVLRDNAVIETVQITIGNTDQIKPFDDPILNGIRQEATAKK